jgi:hypothetical protein
MNDDLCILGVCKGRGFHIMEWYSHATVWVVAFGLTKGQAVVSPALCMML